MCPHSASDLLFSPILYLSVGNIAKFVVNFFIMKRCYRNSDDRQLIRLEEVSGLMDLHIYVWFVI